MKVILNRQSGFTEYLPLFLMGKRGRILSELAEETEDFLLNVDSEEYISYKYSQGHIELLGLQEDRLECSIDCKEVSMRDGKKSKQNVLRFHLPYSGNIELLMHRCSDLDWWMMNISVEFFKGECSFEVNDYIGKSPNEIEEIRIKVIEEIKYRIKGINNKVKEYNACLREEIKKDFEQRKNNILELRNRFSSLGIPIRKKDNVSSTFTIPKPELRKPINVEKPVVKNTDFEPEPTLDNRTYKEILKLIHDVGKEFERLPSLYKDKEEEHLRDHFLMMLSPNFQGSTTGETFNKKGKTDILLRYENTNVFIAECKFWTGKKGFLNTITQLLGYLTWRDSKAAIIMFVSNKDFSSVLNTVRNSINEHPNYIRFDNKQDETWFNYTFHINGDKNRQVKLAVMLYHLPK